MTNGITVESLHALLRRRLVGLNVRVYCDDRINTAHVLRTGRIFALVEVVDYKAQALFDQAHMAVEKDIPRAIFLGRIPKVGNV